MRIRVPGQLHAKTTVVETSHLQALRENNRHLRRQLVEKHNEALRQAGKAERNRQFLAGLLAVLLWWPFRALAFLTGRLISRRFRLAPDFPRKVARVLAFEEQQREAAAATASDSPDEDEVDELKGA